MAQIGYATKRRRASRKTFGRKKIKNKKRIGWRTTQRATSVKKKTKNLIAGEAQAKKYGDPKGAPKSKATNDRRTDAEGKEKKGVQILAPPHRSGVTIVYYKRAGGPRPIIGVANTTRNSPNSGDM